MRVLHFLFYPAIATMLTVATLLIAMVLVSGRFPVWFIICGALMTIAILYTIVVDAWRVISYCTDNAVVDFLISWHVGVSKCLDTLCRLLNYCCR
jgi:uncharacterized membrane protein YedE/YeeE